MLPRIVPQDLFKLIVLVLAHWFKHRLMLGSSVCLISKPVIKKILAIKATALKISKLSAQVLRNYKSATAFLGPDCLTASSHSHAKWVHSNLWPRLEPTTFKFYVLSDDQRIVLGECGACSFCILWIFRECHSIKNQLSEMWPLPKKNWLYTNFTELTIHWKLKVAPL